MINANCKNIKTIFKEGFMSKLIVVVTVICFMFAAGWYLFAGGQKEEPVVEEKEMVKEEPAVSAEGEPDPWFLEIRKDLDKYRTKNDIKFQVPTGQKVTWDDELWLTSEEVQRVRNGNYKVALSWFHLEGEYTQAIIDGITAACEYMGMELVAWASAEKDPVKQKADVESIMALDPDAVIGFPVDTVTGAESFRDPSPLARAAWHPARPTPFR